MDDIDSTRREGKRDTHTTHRREEQEDQMKCSADLTDTEQDPSLSHYYLLLFVWLLGFVKKKNLFVLLESFRSSHTKTQNHLEILFLKNRQTHGGEFGFPNIT